MMTNYSNMSEVIWQLKAFEELSTKELYEILALRTEVFVVEQNCIFQDMDFKDDVAIHILGKSSEGKLLAYSRIFDKDVYYSGYLAIGRVVTKASNRKGGLGIELLEQSIKTCYAMYGVLPIKIGAQKYLTRFYSKFGFKEIGEDYIEDGIPHCIMIKEE